MSAPLWVFGYGSLIWRPDLPYEVAHTAVLSGWARRFWQGSPDHRGTPARPGRVVTLIEAPDAVTIGRVFRVPPSRADAVLTALDHRERAGFDRWFAPVTTQADVGVVRALVYRAATDNPDYLGPAPLETIVAQVRAGRGESGDNATYVLALHDALVAMGVHDAHVAELAHAVRDAR